MHTLDEFLSDVNDFIAVNGFDDVMDLIPYFEAYAPEHWEDMTHDATGHAENATLYESDQLRLVLIHWDGRQQSSVHGHAGGGGLIKVLDGELEETRFDPEDRQVTGRFRYHPGEITYIHDMIALHQVRNPDDTPAYSLHLYTVSGKN